MAKLKIKCVGDEPSDAGGLRLHGVLPGFTDTVLVYVADDGRETLLTNVNEVTFRVAAGSEPASATLVFVNAEIDAEVTVDTRAEEAIQDEIDGAPVVRGVSNGAVVRGLRGVIGYSRGMGVKP